MEVIGYIAIAILVIGVALHLWAKRAQASGRNPPN